MNLETSIYEYAKQGLSLSADRPALWFYGTEISYRDLFLKIDNAADHLYALGVRMGTVVTVHLPNCPQAVIAVYAAAKLGAILNMAHSGMPPAALRENMEFTESSFLITYREDCIDQADTVLYVDVTHHMASEYKEAFRAGKSHRPEGVCAFEDIESECSEKAVIPDQRSLADKCAVYFNSSGTTGEPKTVMHRQASFNHSVVNIRHAYDLDDISHEVMLNALPLFHGSGLVVDVHLGLSGGVQIVQMLKWDAELAVKLINTLKVTSLTAVPRIYASLLQSADFTGETFYHCFVGGDILPDKLRKAFYARTGLNLLDGYGLTEIVCSCAVEPDVPDFKPGLKPFRDFTVAVLNEEGIPVKRGIGELVVSSKTVMLGYLKDEKATEKAKMLWDGKVWIRTGDLGEIDDEGEIHFLDRMKRVIVHNGYNVYPKEIEAVIAAIPEVKEVCAFGTHDPETRTQTVCACVVPVPGVDEEVLRSRIDAECGKLLPSYAMPRRLVFAEGLPRNAMNKVCLEKLEDLLS